MAYNEADITRSALIIVDMQNDFVHADGGFAHRARENPEAKIDMPFLMGTIPQVKRLADAFRKAGRQKSYKDKIMVTTLAPCWYCSGLVRQFGIGTVVVGESVNFAGGIDWLRANGTRVVDLHSDECIDLLGRYIRDNPATWNEDVGRD